MQGMERLFEGATGGVLQGVLRRREEERYEDKLRLAARESELDRLERVMARREDRQWHTGERIAGQEFQATQAGEQRDARARELGEERLFRAGERVAGQEFQSDEARKQREFQKELKLDDRQFQEYQTGLSTTMEYLGKTDDAEGAAKLYNTLVAEKHGRPKLSGLKGKAGRYEAKFEDGSIFSVDTKATDPSKMVQKVGSYETDAARTAKAKAGQGEKTSDLKTAIELKLAPYKVDAGITFNPDGKLDVQAFLAGKKNAFQVLEDQMERGTPEQKRKAQATKADVEALYRQLDEIFGLTGTQDAKDSDPLGLDL